MSEVNPQHDVLCPQGHVIFRWVAHNSYNIMGHYWFKRDADGRSFYSCPVCGDIDTEENDLPSFYGCRFSGANMPNPIQGSVLEFARGVDGVLRMTVGGD